jgi:hypothetical protein
MHPQSKTASELMELEQRYWTAIQEKDGSIAASLSDDPCLVVGASGVGEIDKKALNDMVAAAPYRLKEFSIGDVHVRQLAPNVVVTAYKVKEALVVDGKPVELEAYDSSVWVREGDNWVCGLHTESIAGDPFGRN